jgi:NAD(P)-dependent dehydrogenase (short-subunit alcohol dehydrogenase family)
MTKYLDYGFQGRAAIVTGAGSGIGRSIAEEFAKGGAKVALFGRRLEKLQETKDECMKYSDGVIAVSVDVSDENSVKESVAEVMEAFGRIDILVNNAGFESHLEPGQTYDDIFDKLTPDEYLKFFKVHALGHYLMKCRKTILAEW